MASATFLLLARALNMMTGDPARAETNESLELASTIFLLSAAVLFTCLLRAFSRAWFLAFKSASWRSRPTSVEQVASILMSSSWHDLLLLAPSWRWANLKPVILSPPLRNAGSMKTGHPITPLGRELMQRLFRAKTRFLPYVCFPVLDSVLPSRSLFLGSEGALWNSLALADGRLDMAFCVTLKEYAAE